MLLGESDVSDIDQNSDIQNNNDFSLVYAEPYCITNFNEIAKECEQISFIYYIIIIKTFMTIIRINNL